MKKPFSNGIEWSGIGSGSGSRRKTVHIKNVEDGSYMRPLSTSCTSDFNTFSTWG